MCRQLSASYGCCGAWLSLQNRTIPDNDREGESGGWSEVGNLKRELGKDGGRTAEER